MDKYKKISLVLGIILFINLSVSVVKIGLGYFFTISSLSADGFHSLSDSFSNIIGLIGIKLAAKPADKEHPYGHQKMETIAGFVIGFMLFGIALQIFYQAILWFFNPTIPVILPSTLIALLVTVIVNIFVAYFEYKKGKQYQSDVLITDSIHTKSDIVISAGVLLGLLAIHLGLPPIIDPILSMGIAFFVFHSCFQIFKSSVSVLSDQKAIDELEIIEIARNVDEGILDVYNVRSRGRMDSIYIDLNIMMEADTSVKEAHELMHRLEKMLKEKFKKQIELIAHIEPNTTEINRES